jgi:glycosyltransferase involved in cell wall biosynthesis
VPPERYGGTELFIAQLAWGLRQRGLDVVVYANGASTIETEKRWLYREAQWPLQGEIYDNLKDMNHSSWAVADAARSCDIIHVNNVPGLFLSRFVKESTFFYTVHHPHVPQLSEIYEFFPDINYVTISEFQRRREPMPRMHTVHHGVDIALYSFRERKEQYLSFIGRIAPIKGAHLAVEVAQRTGIPLKIAGEVQPIYQKYFDSEIKPHVDGKLIEYIGEADLAAKNELLGNSLAMLFPIQWDEPFGLVMIEAMACGTPVLALRGGSVEEIVSNGVSGYVCDSVDELVEQAESLAIPAERVRRYAEENFSLETMVEHYVALYREALNERAAPASFVQQRAIA